MKRWRTLLLLAVAAAAAIGHYIYWYGARERPGAPDPQDLPARLLTAGDYDACLWLPYPHQNAAALKKVVGDWGGYIAAAAQAAGAPPPALQSFGPFELPPAREIVACSDLSGERILVAARVYPVLAAVARLAGRLAGNPWLAGGEVTDSDLQQDSARSMLVTWQESLWTVSLGEPPVLPKHPGRAFPETLGILRLGREVSRFPPGSYLLRHQDDHFELSLSSEDANSVPPLLEPDFGSAAPALVAVAGQAWPVEEEKPLPPAAFALFEETAGQRRGVRKNDLRQLPGAAVFQPESGGERWMLPGQGLPRFLIGVLPRGKSAGWEISALDSASLARARDLAPQITALVSPESGKEPAAGTPRLVLGLWADPGQTVGVVRRVHGILDAIPLVDRRQVERWRSWDVLLTPLARCRKLSLLTTELPPSFRLRISGCR